MTTAHPLAYCPTCKIAFPIPPRHEGGTVVFQNSTTNCPNGHFARILNAHYQSFETEIQATLENCGQAVHRAVLALWERLHRHEITPEPAQEMAERIKPGLSSIFDAANFTDPVKEAILAALIADVIAGSEPEDPSIVQQNVTMDVSPTPEAEAPRQTPEKRKGGNRAFQRSLRHRQRVLMNPRD
jgi:hypothetical protein